MSGHSPASCPDTMTIANREPKYLEQLIPAYLILKYNIQTQTPFKNIYITQIKHQSIMEVPEDEMSIRAAIQAAGEKPMICQDKGKREKKEMIENKKKLQKIADILGKKLIFIRSPMPHSKPSEKIATK